MKKIFNKLGDQSKTDSQSSLKENIIKKIKPFTMMDPDRLLNLFDMSVQIIKEGVAGDFVECGTCRGGSAAIIAYNAMQEGWKRDLWLFDSFQGHPKPTSKSGIDKEIMKDWSGSMIASKEDVKLALKTIKSYSKKHAHIVPGWFHKSLKKAKIDNIALIHIDVDWYDATKLCLDILFPKVVYGGYVILDDYNNQQFPGVKEATDAFLNKYNKSVKKIKEVYPALVLQKV